MLKSEALKKICPMQPCEKMVEPSKVQGVPPKLILLPIHCGADRCMFWVDTTESKGDEEVGNCALVLRNEKTSALFGKGGY